MTTITIEYDKGIITITGVNHATGSPDTCHGISTMFYSLEGFLVNNESKIKNHTARLEGGCAYVEFEPVSEDMKAIMGMFYIGLAQVVKTHNGEYAKIKTNDKFMRYLRE